MELDPQLLARIKELKHSRTLVVGIGNELKGDDGIGPLLCRKLTRKKASVEVLNTGTAPENYVEQIIRKSPENLIIIDAADFGGKPGEARLFEPGRIVPGVLSTHGVSLRLFLNLIEQRIPVQSFCIGIQTFQTRLNSPVSTQVAESAETLSCAIAEIFAPT